MLRGGRDSRTKKSATLSCAREKTCKKAARGKFECKHGTASCYKKSRRSKQ